MKLLIMCEGANEKKIIDLLLENDCLQFTEDDLLDLNSFHARQIVSNPQVRIALNTYPGEVTVIRIGDKQSDKLTIPIEYKDKIVEQRIYCTKPELEMLLIIAEGLEKEYEKVKGSVKPKQFAKARVRLGKKMYDNSTQFYQDYFGADIDMLVNSIKEYQRVHGKAHSKDEHCLAELLK
ncbi:MAG: GNAT family acetyltransferase [Lachnospiraceae bacterium]|nr:GNAT family acetyltransferase [Lachnospiraceae bacterium]